MGVNYYTLTDLRNYLNDRFKYKKTGKSFSIADTQLYIKRGYIPKYLGNVKIKKDTKIGSGTKLYTLVETAKKEEK